MAGNPNSSVTVAVIGLGAQGLVAVKNMLEEGYSVTGFDSNDFIGGIWHYTARDMVEALPSTVVNVSRQRACFSDFPFPQATSSFPTAPEFDKYLNSYTDHFNLRPHLQLSTTIQSVKRNDVDTVWEIVAQKNESEPRTLLFHKVIVAVGPHSIPQIPELQDKEKFQGTILHSKNFKDPSEFDGKRVMVVGAGNTAGDTSTSLVSHASSVYLSHRNGAAVIPRVLKNGSSIDHSLTYRLFSTKDAIDFYFPGLSKKFMDNWLNGLIQSEWGGYDPQWRLSPFPSLIHQVPMVSDYLIPRLRDKSITSTAAPRRILGPDLVELEDGQTVNVDAIIFCTGYKPDFAFLGRHNPTILLPSDDNEKEKLIPQTPSTNYHATPLLYQNVFSLEYPDSLAFNGMALIAFPAYLLSDLASMAMAQLWSEKPNSPSLPSSTEMYSWWNKHFLWSQSVRRLSPSQKFTPLNLQSGSWLAWIQDVIGANVDEHLSMLSPQAWRFWLQDRAFCSLLVHGVASPHMYRLFDSKGRRKSWNGARAAIEAVNEDVRNAKKANNARMQA